MITQGSDNSNSFSNTSQVNEHVECTLHPLYSWENDISLYTLEKVDLPCRYWQKSKFSLTE